MNGHSIAQPAPGDAERRSSPVPRAASDTGQTCHARFRPIKLFAAEALRVECLVAQEKIRSAGTPAGPGRVVAAARRHRAAARWHHCDDRLAVLAAVTGLTAAGHRK